MLEGLKIRRTVWQGNGKIEIRIDINHPRFQYTVTPFFTPHGVVLGCTSFDDLQRLFPALTREEILRCFNKHLKSGWPDCARLNKLIIVPVAKEAVKAVTRFLEAGLKAAFEDLAALQKKKNLQGWLWNSAVAEPPDYRFRPVGRAA